MASSDEVVVSNRDLWKQALQDFGGKEVQNGYTLTYVWMANQLGHFTLGFLLSLLLTWLVQWILPADCCSLSPFEASPRNVRLQGDLCGWAIAIALLQLVGWIVKETYDYHVAKCGTAGHAFGFNGWDVLRDAATAVAFIAFGIVVAFASLLSWRLGLLSFAVGLLLALIPARYWLSRKYCFQRGKLPYLFRLSDFEGAFKSEGAVGQINTFLDDPGRACSHLLIFGQIGSGRTGLAVAILTEHLFKVRRARYMTWAKFVETADRAPQEQDTEDSWRWQDSDILVLDDVVEMVGNQVIDSPQGIEARLDLLDNQDPGTIEGLNRRSTVWVLAAAVNGAQEQWVEMLAGKLGVNPSAIVCVDLRAAAQAKTPRRPMASFLGH